MHAGTKNTQEIFGPTQRLEVPLFQRPYVWTKEKQWEPLWHDIRNVADYLHSEGVARPHFLGAMVLDQQFVPTGSVPTRLVVDGQQRLTTLQLVLEALADLCHANRAPQHYQAIQQVTRNVIFGTPNPDLEFKVWPTNVDQDVFRELMLAESASELLTAYGRPADKLPLLTHAYIYFHQAIDTWLNEDTAGIDARLGAMCNTVLFHLRMIVIDLDRDDDAQLIFETLNARGTPLLPSDLVKNFLFHRAKLQKKDIDALYRGYWQTFDDPSRRYWRVEIGRGHAARARLDLFLQYYLSARTANEVPVGHLYNRFRDYAAEAEGGDAEVHLNDLKSYAGAYQLFDDPGRAGGSRKFIERLNTMGLVTAYPFLLELLVRFGPDSEVTSQINADLESFLVRRMICQLSTRGYGRWFVGLLPVLQGVEGPPEVRLREALMASRAENARWPDDTEFHSAWMGLAATQVLARGRVRMVLEAVALQMHSTKTEKVQIVDPLTVEHILPSSWRGVWRSTEDMPVDEQAELDHLLHTFGNLTLVRGNLNSGMSNNPWHDKREALREHTVLKMNQSLLDYPEWNDRTIRKRGAVLFEYARAVWPYPAQ